NKTIHGAVVPTLMLRHPVVVDVVRTGRIRCGGVQVERQECPHGWARNVRWIGLLECHALVEKSADAAIAAEIVIEGTVFLDQDDDVFDVAKFGACRRAGASHNATATAAAI